MNYQDSIEMIQKRLSQTVDKVEKFHLLHQLAEEYRKMWKLNKALETCQEALNIGQELLREGKIKAIKTRKKRKSNLSSIALS